MCSSDLPSEVEAGAEPWDRARRSFLWRLRLDLAAVSLTLAGGTVVGARQTTLFSCQVSQWRGEVTAVTSALPTKVASLRSLPELGLGRVEGVPVT